MITTNSQKEPVLNYDHTKLYARNTSLVYNSIRPEKKSYGPILTNMQALKYGYKILNFDDISKTLLHRQYQQNISIYRK